MSDQPSAVTVEAVRVACRCGVMLWSALPSSAQPQLAAPSQRPTRSRRSRNSPGSSSSSRTAFPQLNQRIEEWTTAVDRWTNVSGAQKIAELRAMVGTALARCPTTSRLAARGACARARPREGAVSSGTRFRPEAATLMGRGSGCTPTQRAPSWPRHAECADLCVRCKQKQLSSTIRPDPAAQKALEVIQRLTRCLRQQRSTQASDQRIEPRHITMRVAGVRCGSIRSPLRSPTSTPALSRSEPFQRRFSVRPRCYLDDQAGADPEGIAVLRAASGWPTARPEHRRGADHWLYDIVVRKPDHHGDGVSVLERRRAASVATAPPKAPTSVGSPPIAGSSSAVST